MVLKLKKRRTPYLITIFLLFLFVVITSFCLILFWPQNKNTSIEKITVEKKRIYDIFSIILYQSSFLYFFSLHISQEQPDELEKYPVLNKLLHNKSILLTKFM